MKKRTKPTAFRPKMRSEAVWFYQRRREEGVPMAAAYFLTVEKYGFPRFWRKASLYAKAIQDSPTWRPYHRKPTCK